MRPMSQAITDNDAGSCGASTAVRKEGPSPEYDFQKSAGRRRIECPSASSCDAIHRARTLWDCSSVVVLLHLTECNSRRAIEPLGSSFGGRQLVAMQRVYYAFIMRIRRARRSVWFKIASPVL